MPPSKNDEQLIISFSKSLEATNDLVQKLLEDIHEGEISFTELRVEMRNLISSFQDLSQNLKNKDSEIKDLSIKTAVLENSIDSIKDLLSALDEKMDEEDKKDSAEKTNEKSANTNGKWAVRAALVAGVASMVVAAITSIQSCIK